MGSQENIIYLNYDAGYELKMARYEILDYAASQLGSLYHPRKLWLATINLVFAIGTVCSYLITAE